MEFKFKVTTPGHRLSLATLGRISGSFENIIRESMLETVVGIAEEAGIHPDRARIGHLIAENTKRVDSRLCLEDVQKGSWIFFMATAVIGLMGKVVYDLGIDYIKQHERWQDIIRWLNDRTAKPCAKAAEQKLLRLEKIGQLKVSKRSVEVVSSQDGVSLCVKYECVLVRVSENSLPGTTSEQLAMLKQEFGYPPDE